jgi:hypothetical protein
MIKPNNLSRSKKRLAILGVFAAFALVVAALALRTSDSNPDLDLGQFERLQPGMTQAEVEQVLGSPPLNVLRYRALIWLPQPGGRTISAEIAPESPVVEFPVREDKPKNAVQPQQADSINFFPQETGEDGDQAVWIGRRTLVAVYFGPDSRLRHRYSSTVQESVPPSVMDWLASRPQIIRRSLGF